MDLENFTMDYYWLHAQDFILYPARWRAGFSSHREPRAAGPPASTLGRACLCLSAATLPLGRAGRRRRQREPPARSPSYFFFPRAFVFAATVLWRFGAANFPARCFGAAFAFARARGGRTAPAPPTSARGAA